MSVLIKGGRIITASDDYIADIYITGETISAVGASLDVTADTVIDASGKYVLPGGVDPHTHMEMPFGGTVTCDDFTSGTTSAVFGGTTTIVDFCLQQSGQTLPEALQTWHGKLRRSPPVADVGFHLAVTDLDYPGALDDLAALPGQGVTSCKFFMAYKGTIMVEDETLFKAMQVIARSGGLAMVHAENGDVVDVLVKQALAAGRTEPKWHAATRPPETEGEATSRAIQLAHLAGCALYVVHVSCREAIRPIAEARQLGWQTWGETCPQYLLLDGSALDKPGFEGAKYVYTPPSRGKADQKALWLALGTDALSVISTDHCPFNWDGQKSLGADDFSAIPNGAPGIENRLHLIHDRGARTGKLSLNRMVELTATNPAKLFGMYPRKGTIAAGSDADLVVFDPERRHRISARTHHSRVDYSLFEGEEVTGAPETVLVRGRIAVSDGKLLTEPGHGRFLRRGTPAAARTAT
jgi:dihydropyrimidinase